MNDSERYEFEISEEGLDYDILDKSYNSYTQKLILDNGLKEGMKVLDVGCGAGVMTAWLASQVGKDGSIVAVDNSQAQLQLAKKLAQSVGIKNISFNTLSAYDVEQLETEFDAIYCRFLLHHLHSPRKAIKAYFNSLRRGGIYFGQEGIVNAAFAYPATFAWYGYQVEATKLETITEGHERDGNFGMKLHYECIKAGFTIKNCQLHQPVLWNREQKKDLLSSLEAYKQTELSNRMSENEWQKKYDETLRIISNDTQLIGFYNSCFVAAQK